ncbi:hypothetical protein [Streptomyces barkulensis]|uniref:hypothetical protein n=1 Tax=Streptomyces barkulensis TaxID=1257026 RepID=UPI000C6D5290|nr:hypothetical protein [Streptomyces barkulensis]
MGKGQSSNSGPLGCGFLIIIALIVALVQQCGGEEEESSASKPARPSASASAEDSPKKPARQKPPKVTLSLAEIAETPGTFERFKKFVAEHGTARQKEVVSHLTGWRGFRRGTGTGIPALEVKSDYPVVDFAAMDAGDEKELDLLLDLQEESQHAAEAFAAWWKADESKMAVLQIFDREDVTTYGSTCIDPHSVRNGGSCWPH